MDRWGPEIGTHATTAQPSVGHRRIAIARDRPATWTRHRAMLAIEPGRPGAPAGAIEKASAALEGLRPAVETLGRGPAHRAIARQANAAACEADPVRTGTDPRPVARPSRGAGMGHPSIIHARVPADGRVRLHMRCPGLGQDPTVRVLVRRRVGRRGAYEPIGYARGSTYADRNPKRCGRFAAYKIEVIAGPMAGATSRRALADFLISNPTRGHAHTHPEPAGPAMAWAGQGVASRAA